MIPTLTLFEKLRQMRHPNTQTCIEIAERLAIHADGRCPQELIHKRRPNESEETFTYRKEIYVSRTQEPISKVSTSLEKIRRSQDWSIQYNSDNVSKKIAKGETLEDYCEFHYSDYTSLTNWAFSELLQRSLIDANSICAVILKSVAPAANVFEKPEVEIFGSKQIISFVPNEYYLLKSADVVMSNVANGVLQGEVYYFITTSNIARYEINSGVSKEIFNFTHNIGELPVFKVGGLFYERKNNDTIQKSRIAKMVPFLNEAAREYSDFQAEMVQHIYSEKYIYSKSDCADCKGFGKIRNKEGEEHDCKKCGGKGKIISAPYGVHIIDPSRVGEGAVPTPPIGYVGKDIGIAKFLSEHVDENIYKALSSVNMEFLAQTPLNQSGTAKEIDTDELNNFVSGVAEDIVKVLDNCYKFINEYRYMLIVPDKTERAAMLPKVQVPEKFGLINSNILMQEIATAKTSKINPILQKSLEIDFARKKFNYNPEIVKELETIFELDAFYGYDQQEKMTMLSNGGITEIDYIVSCNIAQFVQRAEKENADFYRKSFAEKRKIIRAYAEEIIKDNSAKEQIQKTVVEDIVVE